MYHSRIVPTNQPHGHAGSWGLAGRTGSGNPGGAGSGGRNTTTPTGMYNPGTKFRVGDAVMLLTNCGPTFPKDTIVEITGIEPTPESATKRPGQAVAWLRSDEDSVYRFQRVYAKDTSGVVTSMNSVEPASHYDLAPGLGQPYAAEQYALFSVLYTLKDMTFLHNSNRNLVSVPRHTSCQVVQYATRKGDRPGGRQGGRELIAKLKTERCFYVLQARYLTYDWDTEVCSRKKEVSNFRALTPSELRQYRARQLPANRVINWQ